MRPVLSPATAEWLRSTLADRTFSTDGGWIPAGDIAGTASGDTLVAGYEFGPVTKRWLEWSRDAKDVGNQTRAVLGAARRIGTGEALLQEACRFAGTHPKSAGNGSLMRTAPLAILDEDAGLIEDARAVRDLPEHAPQEFLQEAV